MSFGMPFPKVDLTPVLLTTIPGVRAARVAHLTQAIAEATTLISRYDQSLESDDNVQFSRQLELLRAQCIFSLSPISAIAEEILLRIFDWVIHINCGVATRIPPRSIKIASSCAPQISEIHFHGEIALNAVRIRDHSIAQLRLDCIRAIDIPFTWSNSPSYLLRMPRLELIGSTFGAGLLSGITFDYLRSLSLGKLLNNETVPLLVDANMPALETLNVCNASSDIYTISPPKDFPSLRRLELDDTHPYFHRTAGSTLLFPDLEELLIERESPYRDWEFRNQELPLLVRQYPSIKTLHLHVANADDLARIFTGLLEDPESTPLLCHLQLTLRPLTPSSYGFGSPKEVEAPSILREKLRARVMGTISVPPLQTLVMSSRAAGEYASWYAAEAQHFEVVDPLIREE
ncbi:hypothetical protein DL93DRAFT_2183223 [Clavulina sp. PMI_390]|nr:hypothetical protein DL93DRAFT_2183223 [Clavulina sp. PMI_390]